jgi:hypothetical protein
MMLGRAAEGTRRGMVHDAPRRAELMAGAGRSTRPAESGRSDRAVVHRWAMWHSYAYTMNSRGTDRTLRITSAFG